MDPGPAGPPSPEPKETNPTDVELLHFSDQVAEPNNDDRDSCSTSTSSDDSDDDDDDDNFFHIEPTAFGLPTPFGPVEPVRSPQTPTQTEHGENSGSVEHTSRNHIEEHIQTHPGEFKPPVHPILRHDVPDLVPPTVRYDVPDPNRIPSSIFTRTKSTSPMEWSIASNESLFSIHMGNASFSRDHVFLAGRSGELSNYSGSPKDGSPTPSISPPSPLPPLPPASPMTTTAAPVPAVLSNPANTQIRQGLEQPGVAEAANAEAMKDVLRAAVTNHDKEKSIPNWIHNSANISRQSDGSISSFRSFAFPILTGSERRSGSIKTEPEQQRMQQQQQTPKEAAPAPAPTPPPATSEGGTTDKGWLSCFSCCASCCP